MRSTQSRRTIRLIIFAVLCCLMIPSGLAQEHQHDQGPVPDQELPEIKAEAAVITAVMTPTQVRKAILLIESLRQFGGPLRDAPVFVAFAGGAGPLVERLHRPGVILVPLESTPLARSYPFAWKVGAAAQFEKLLAGKVPTLVWFDPECLVVAPPDQLLLRDQAGVAVRPVHLANAVGLPEGAPLDGYWEAIHKATGAPREKIPVIQSFVDGKKLQAYYNLQIYSVKTDLGLLTSWWNLLARLVGNNRFQAQYNTDPLHQVFLHQALFSSLLVAQLGPERIRLLPAEYSYPWHLHKQVPAPRQAASLNKLRTVVLDRLWEQDPLWLFSIPMDEPLSQWLEKTVQAILQVTDRIAREELDCNSYVVKTSAGSVLIDSGGSKLDGSFLLHRPDPVKAIFLTHAHTDHTAGIELWKKPGIPVIAQAGHEVFIRHHVKLSGFFARRDAAQGNVRTIDTVKIEPTEFFEDQTQRRIGDLTFEAFHTPGETPDMALIWIPELKAAFVGDNFSRSFPNLSPPRGAKPRWALDWIHSLDLVIAKEPEVLLPGHGEPVLGAHNVKTALEGLRNGIQFIHDEVVRGMNEGKDVYTLMREISLPERFGLSQTYARVAWSVRGIYESYAGWFDGNPVNLYPVPASAVFPDLVQLAGGPEPVLKRAQALFEKGEAIPALHLLDAVLATDLNHAEALRLKLRVLQALNRAADCYLERQWLTFGIRETEKALASFPQTPAGSPPAN